MRLMSVVLNSAQIFLQIKQKNYILYTYERICNQDLFTININNNAIKNVESLKILSIHFSKKYTWKEHYISLKKSLVQRVNLIRFLSSKRSYLHINTLAYLVKSLILSKVDYGLFLVGRLSIYAFRTTPLDNIYIESGLPSIEFRIYESNSKILAKLSFPKNSIVDNDVKIPIPAKRTYRYSSAICESLKLSETIGIPKLNKTYSLQHPP